MEWYVNDERGLEQGFTVLAPPEEHPDWPSAGDDEQRRTSPAPLVLLMTLNGDLSPLVSGDAQAIEFVTAAGARALRYSALIVVDATGRLLPARIDAWSEGGSRGIRILVEDRDAVWPITIDPLLTSPAWTAESDQAGARFGFSVRTAGDVNGDGYGDVVVGAYAYDNGETDEGRAFVYHGSASGLSLTANWTAESGQAGAEFGNAVGTAGDVNGDGYADVIVGANRFNNGQIIEGAAFVYHGSASGLSATANWTAEGNLVAAFFGRSVGTAGDVNGDGYSDVIVGAYNFTNDQSQEGRAFAYHGSASGLSATADWTAESDQAASFYGISVGTAGDVNGDGYADVIVGAYLFDNGESDEGGAFVYHGSSSGLSPAANWTGESGQANAWFGQSVGTAGDVNGDGYADVIVGAYTYDNGETDEGRAFVYHGSDAGLSAGSSWTAEADQAFSYLGYSVGTAGDVNGDGYADVIVGAYFFDNGESDEGRAYVYHGSNSGLSSAANWTGESDQGGAWFGFSVGTAGDVNGDGYADVIVGAYSYDNGETDEGRAVVHHGSATGLSLVAGWTAESDQEFAYFGYSVGTAGDINGDGYADVIVGAFNFDNGEGDEGRAFAYHGSASGLSPTANWTAEGDQAGARLGFAVGAAGDVNGDGYGDVIVGAFGFDNGQTDEGRVIVYHGSATGLSLTADWAAESDQASAVLGRAVGTAGDVNGDGYGDVIVSAYLFDNGQTDEGRTFVYHGSASGLSLTANWMAEGEQANAEFGFAVGTAGDVNRDGYADVIVGADRYNNGEVLEGRAFVYHGSASGLSAAANWTAESNLVAAFFGRTVGTAGDVNGDGFSDVIVGAYNFTNDQSQEGRAFVYHGSGAGLSLAPNWTGESDQAAAFYGVSVGTAGDVNGDGYADVIVAAYNYDNGQTDEGRVFVYHGSAAGLSSTANWMAESDQANAWYGFSVGTAGDVNGDGYADVIVGGYLFDNGLTDEGRVFVYYGNGGPGLSLRPRQRRSDGAAPIAPLGASDSTDGFRLSALGHTPFGRGLVKLEWEVESLASLLDGTATQMSTSWIDTGAAGASLDELVAGLSSGTVHHWRARLRYHPATTPFQGHSRWFTVPWNGWQEGDLRTPALTNLTVSQTEGADPVLMGEDLVYTVSVSNAGPEGALGTIVQDTLPVGASFVAATPSQGSCGAPVAGVVTCNLGLVSDGGGATVTITVTPASPGSYTNAAEVSSSGVDPDTGDNTSYESTTVLPIALGDRVWEDTNGDGIQDAGEPHLAGVLVALYDGAGNLMDATLTNGSGAYNFPDLTFGATYRIRFIPPAGYLLTAKDQGTDDALDSDADSVSQLTPAIVLTSVQDLSRWDAGLVVSCQAPDEPLYIYAVTLSTDGNDYPILHFQDANQPTQVTGYNVYRSFDPGAPPASWPLVASDVIDMDEGTPNKQWVDTSGDDPPGAMWFYLVTAYNAWCPAEGPF